jgi:serine phosphatase RsbU (regulator of sigma subunit)
MSTRSAEFARFFRGLPLGSKLAFFAAVFCCFAPIGIVTDVSNLGRTSPAGLAVFTVYSGGIAVLYAGLAMARLRWMPLAIVIHVGLAILLPRWFPLTPEMLSLDQHGLAVLQTRLTTVSLISVALMGLAYALFLLLFTREGRRFSAVQTEMRLARDIHQTLVPAIAGHDAHGEWLGRSVPSGDVGGDLVDVISTESGWWGVIADVTGHGVAAGVVMGMFKTALHAHVNAAASPGELLERINRTLGPLRQPNMMVTVACVRRRSATELEYALAGHPPLLHLARGWAQPSWVGEPQFAIGLIDDTTYQTGRLRLAPGDVVLALTDGLLEVFDRQEREIGPDGILAAITSAPRDASLDVLHDRIFDVCRRHGAQQDDQTLLLLRAH